MVTVNDIINAVSLAIDGSFGASCTIYTNDVEQGLKNPCFFIMVIDDTQERVIGNRYDVSHTLDIHYFPENDDNHELHQVEGILFDILEYVTVDTDLIEGEGMKGTIVDGILHFSVTFNYQIIKQKVLEDSMEGIAIDSKLKG